MDEGWTDKIAAQNMEGCQITGKVRVNKVSQSDPVALSLIPMLGLSGLFAYSSLHFVGRR